MLPNGNHVVLGTDNRVMDMSAVIPGGMTAAMVSGAVFQERTLGGTTVFEWKSLDHIPVTDATEDVDLAQKTIDYIHINSIHLDTDGNYLVSCRHLDEVLKIDRNTGSVMWRLGGSKSKHNQFTILGDTENGFTGFSHQHEVVRTRAGHLIMFDNGNLKPIAYSRAVEYELDEALKTARRTWSYRPSKDVFTYSMGSVQELDNGNILIGWGQSQSPIVAQEVSRDGTVQVELSTDSLRILSYSVHKAVFAMSGVERTVSSPGTYSFTRADSNTRMSVTLTRVDAPTSIITERHSVRPHGLDFASAVPCTPLEMRWVIRVSDTSKIAGTTRFALGVLPAYMPPSRIKLYRRLTEGKGKFVEVTTTLDAPAGVLRANSVSGGEYTLAFGGCFNPSPVSPASGTRSVPVTPTLVWSEGLTVDGYDVEIFLGSIPAPVYVFRTFRLDTTMAGLETGALYSWRVRARRAADNPWSKLSSFRTVLDVPTPISPSSLPDSMSVLVRPVFNWSAIPRANKYRLQVFTQSSEVVALDTVIQSTSFQGLNTFDWHQWYFWHVSAMIDEEVGPPSNNWWFLTQPAPPEYLAPLAADLQVDPENAELAWQVGFGGTSYHIRVLNGLNPDPMFQDTLSTLRLRLPTLDPVTRYYWQVRSANRYGVSEWTEKRWFLTLGSETLQAPVLLTPVNKTLVDTSNPELGWTEVDRASGYYVQLTTTPTFETPDFEWFGLTFPSIVVPRLESGRLYLWRVVAIGVLGSGPWSSIVQFSTQPGTGDRLRTLIPVDTDRRISSQGFGSFITNTMYASYRAEFSTHSDFRDIAFSIDGAASPLPFSLDEGTQYWWRVIGVRGGVEKDTGASASFTTVAHTSVNTNDQGVGSRPLIEVRNGSIDLSGDIMGSRIQIFDLLGRLLSTYLVPRDVTHWTHLIDDLHGMFVVAVIPPTEHAAPQTFILMSTIQP